MIRRTPLKRSLKSLRRSSRLRGGRSTSAPTKAEAARMATIKEIGCIVARKKGLGFMPCDVHHLLSGGRRRGHLFTVGLNEWSHRGVTISGMMPQECESLFGPSLARGSKQFHAEFGSDEELLAYQNKLLKEHRAGAARRQSTEAHP